MLVCSDLALYLPSSRFLRLALWLSLSMLAPLPALSQSTPVVASVMPDSFVAGSPDTGITVYGTGFTSDSVVDWNGAGLSTTFQYDGTLYATVPAADLSKAGTASLTVDTPEASPALSSAVTLQITNPPAPTLGGVYPSAGPINAAAAVTLNGTGFTAETTVTVNGATIPSEFVGSGEITATIPAADLALPGNVNIKVTTPAPGGGTSAAMTFTTFIGIANNDIVYNPADGLLYASVLVSGTGTGGNTVDGIDPATGKVKRRIWVGSNPNKLALSSDHTQLFVGLDGAAAVAQVSLAHGEVVRQFHLGGGPGLYDPPYTALALAAVPGEPNSVAVSSNEGVVLYDSGVRRAKGASQSASGLSFGASSRILYAANGGIQELTVGDAGITRTKNFPSSGNSASALQYDNGRLYLSSGQVLSASSGALLGSFYTSGDTQASGPVVSDSALSKAFVGTTDFSSNGQISAFNENTFTLSGSIPVNGVGEQGYPTNFQKIVRWGQDGLALSAAYSAFSSVNQIFIFHSSLVKNLGAAPADLSVKLTAPANAATGAPASWVAAVTNHGPYEAEGATLAMNLDPSLSIARITTTQGSCGNGAEFVCDLGNLAKGASVSVTVSARPTSEGTLAGAAAISSITLDPSTANNQSTTSTAVTGNLYNPPPSISAISPNLVQAGTAEFTLTVTGEGFTADSVVRLGSEELDTTLESATQLTATVTAAQIKSYGWAPVTVANPAPGGGVSQLLPLTIYDLVNVPANGIAFDPYSQVLFATVPSAAAHIAGNSVVGINPTTGAMGKPVFVGSQPTVIAETSDGKYLYINLSGANRLAQFDLEQRRLIATIPVTLTQGGYTSSVSADWLAAMPGSDTALAINAEGEGGTFGIFDVKGKTGKFRPKMSGTYDGSNPVFASASRIYAYDNQTTGAEFYRYDVNEDGVTVIDGTTLDGMGGFGGLLDLGSNGLVYGSGGGIVNPFTTTPSQIATLPSIDFAGSGSSGAGDGNIADASLQKEFMMLENLAGTSAFGLVRYNLSTYVPEAILNFPQSLSGASSAWTMLRFGQDGLALLSAGENYATDQIASTLIVLRGPFVAPQLLTKDSAAKLTSSSATSIPVGTGNTILKVTGSNFQPGVAVTWNGNYRTTTIVDAKHLKVNIPATDLAHAGEATLVATNPGAPASNALHTTIDK